MTVTRIAFDKRIVRLTRAFGALLCVSTLQCSKLVRFSLRPEETGIPILNNINTLLFRYVILCGPAVRWQVPSTRRHSRFGEIGGPTRRVRIFYRFESPHNAFFTPHKVALAASGHGGPLLTRIGYLIFTPDVNALNCSERSLIYSWLRLAFPEALRHPFPPY